MAKENTILAVDIGGESLKMAEFSFLSAGKVQLEKFAFMEYGEQDKDATASEVFSVTYEKMLDEHQFKSKSVRLSISGQAAFSRLSKLPPLGENRQRVEQIVEYEAKQTVPYPMNEVVWDYQLVQRVSASDASESSPVAADEAAAESSVSAVPDTGLTESAEMESLFIAVKRDLVEPIAEIIQDSGKDVLSIEIAPIAFFNAAKANEIGNEHCDLLLNIGGRCSNLVFADKGRIFTRTIPIAGNSITQQIAKEFGISFADAEELKRRHGFVALGGAYEEPDSEVAATVSKIARNVMTRLHGEINRSINVWRSQYGGNRPQRLFLGGGSSLMAYTPRFFNEKLKMPVEYLNVFQVVAIAPGINKEELLEVAPMFSELIGLGLRQIVDCPVEISLTPESVKRFKALQKKKPYFYASAVSMALCLLIFYWGVNRRLQFDKIRVDRTKEEVKKTKAMVDKIKSAMQEMSGVKSQYDEALKIIDSRRAWIGLLNELQTILPDVMWFVNIAQADSKTSKAAGSDNIFGGGVFGGGKGKSTSGSRSEISSLKLVGYTLVLQPNLLLEDRLKKSLLKSEIFGDGDDAVEFKSFEGDRGTHNIISFELLAKLKQPLKK